MLALPFFSFLLCLLNVSTRTRKDNNNSTTKMLKHKCSIVLGNIDFPGDMLNYSLQNKKKLLMCKYFFERLVVGVSCAGESVSESNSKIVTNCEKLERLGSRLCLLIFVPLYDKFKLLFESYFRRKFVWRCLGPFFCDKFTIRKSSSPVCHISYPWQQAGDILVYNFMPRQYTTKIFTITRNTKIIKYFSRSFPVVVQTNQPHYLLLPPTVSLPPHSFTHTKQNARQVYSYKLPVIITWFYENGFLLHAPFEGSFLSLHLSTRFASSHSYTCSRKAECKVLSKRAWKLQLST